MKKYNLWVIDHFTLDVVCLGEVPVNDFTIAPSPQVLSVLQMIVEHDHAVYPGTKAVIGDVYATEVEHFRSVFLRDDSIDPADKDFLTRVKIVAAYGIDIDETGYYFLTEEQ